jgi:hypothetical protein
MAQVLQLRRGTTAQSDAFTGAVAEVSVDTDRDSLRVHDGTTMGGKEIAPLQVAVPLLPAASLAAGADEVPIIQGGVARRATKTQILNGIVDSNISASAAIALSKLATGALPTAITVATANIVDANVTTAKIADANVTTAKIADANVTQAKLASNVTTTGPAFRAYASGNTTVAASTNQKVALATEDFDTGSCFASSRFTPNIAGYYFIAGSIRIDSAAAATVMLWKNGSTYSRGSSGDGTGYVSTVCDLIYLNGTTDYVELYATHSFAGNKTVGASQTETFMAGFLARAA